MIRICSTVVAAALAGAAAGFLAIGAGPAGAQESVTIQISIKNHKFQPAQIRGPAGRQITLRIRNLDATPAEFESVSLRVEKVIAGNGEGIINIRPLQPGRYDFFDDFHKDSQGTLIVQ